MSSIDLRPASPFVSMDEKCSKRAMKSETNQKPNAEDPGETEKKKGLALLIHDLKQRKLIPIKILSLIVFSGYGVLLPFAAIHMKSLGISVEETGAVNSVSAILGVVAPICVGILADKLGNFKVLLSVLFGSTSINSLLFLLVPVGRISTDYPTIMPMALGCLNDNPIEYPFATVTLTDLDLHHCKFKLEEDLGNNFINLSVTLEECGSMCYNSENSFEVSGSKTNQLTSSSFVNNTIGKEFRNAVFFPNDWDLEMICSQNFTEEGVCQLVRKSGTGSRKERNATLGLHLLNDQNNKNGTFPVKWMIFEDESEFQQKDINFQCSSYGEHQELIQISQGNETENWFTVYSFCQSQCMVQVKRSDLCSNKAWEESVNPKFTFWTYLLLRFVFEVFIGGSAVLFDGAAMVLVNEVRGDFGFQRVFGFIGIAIFSPISGALMEQFSANEHDSNFRPAFFLFAGLFGIAALGMLTIDLNSKPPAKKLTRDVITLFKNVELDVLFVISLISGILQSSTGNYLFLFLEEIGGTRSLMGLSITISCLTAIPLLLLSDTLFRKFSIPNIMVFCLLTYVVRLIGYSYISNPYLCLVYESIEAISGALTVTSHMVYATQLGTTSTVTSIQGLISAAYFGLGAGIGNYVGSFLIGAYGQRLTFRIMGVVAFITGFLYFLFNIFYLRPITKKRINDTKVDLNVNEKIEEVQRDLSSSTDLC